MTTVYITHPRFAEHTLPGHPEHAGRIQSAWQELDAAGLSSRMQAINPKPIEIDHILWVHTQQFVDLLTLTSEQNQLVMIDSDTYALPTSYEIARLAAGGIAQAVDEIVQGRADNGLAVVRPPGHHATPTRPMGFCILGNIAIAARYAQITHQIQKVLIVDYDVHHGNGTQDIFYDDDSILFISTHQSPFYPGTGSLRETGHNKGRGYTINIPLPGGHGDDSYAAIYEQIVWAAARRFQPELILVSAGFDAHWQDPLALMRLSMSGYDHLTRQLIRMAEELCDGRILFVMEGGYDLKVIGYGIRNIAHALLGDNEVSDPYGDTPGNSPNVQPIIQQIKEIHNL